jgi:DNA helicase-2/ATP-dependent DNA helicase PcrA
MDAPDTDPFAEDYIPPARNSPLKGALQSAMMTPADTPLIPPDDDPLLKNLNTSQQEAVVHGEGPLLIFAGAGSGKTRVLTHRIAYLIGRRGVRPRNILAVTFTNKAASEMKERLTTLLGEPAVKELWVGTFHATCARILRERGQHIGLPRDFVVYDDGDQVTLIKECLSQLNLDDRQYAPRAVLSFISRAKEQLVAPEDFPRRFHGVFESVVAKIYALYQEKLKLNRALDFDDLIGYAVRILREREDDREYYQNKFRHVLVDEYQDTNHAQYMLTRLLSQGTGNLCVVGDDDQSIYSWRGADVGFILEFERDNPQAKIVKLEQNYRSTQTILDAAYHVVRNNKGRKDKRLWTENATGDGVHLHEAMNEQEEGVYIAETIRERKAQTARNWRDFAILYRTNAQSRALEEVFINFRVPYRIIGGVRFYERKEIKDIMSYVRLVHNPYDSVSLRRVINVPARGIGAGTWVKIEEQAAMHGVTLWDIVTDLKVVEGVKATTRKEVEKFAALIASLRGRVEAGKLTVTQVVQEILEHTGYLRALEAEKTVEAQTRAENVKELLTVTQQFENTTEDPTLSAFLEQTALIADIDTLEENADAVTMMTLHAAKGLEFPVVFLVGMEEGIFPHFRALQADKEMEEERRLAYVGITRAREDLHLTYATRRTLFGNTQFNPMSRFIREIPNEYYAEPPRRAVRAMNREDDYAARAGTWRNASASPQRLTTTMQNMTAKPEAPKSPTVGDVPFRTGQKVKHAVFGTGTVLSCIGQGDEAQVQVAFPNVGIKKLVAGYARLEKVT